jgi:uncharacterized membrane protein
MIEGALPGPLGSALAILAMGLATYLCRSSGVVLMSRVRITPRVERALRALPGCIVVSTVLPIVADAGFAAALGLLAALLAMIRLRVELAALAAGLLVVWAARGWGL